MFKKKKSLGQGRKLSMQVTHTTREVTTNVFLMVLSIVDREFSLEKHLQANVGNHTILFFPFPTMFPSLLTLSQTSPAFYVSAMQIF